MVIYSRYSTVSECPAGSRHKPLLRQSTHEKIRYDTSFGYKTKSKASCRPMPGAGASLGRLSTVAVPVVVEWDRDVVELSFCMTLGAKLESRLLQILLLLALLATRTSGLRARSSDVRIVYCNSHQEHLANDSRGQAARAQQEHLKL